MFSRFKGWRRAAWLLLPLPLLALAVLLRPQPSPPNILLILVDTLRADRLGTYGNTHGLTPFLDQLASQGTLFEHAYSTTSWTSQAVASLFTSRYPSQHRIVNYESKLADDEITLAMRLQQAGYTTAAFVANSQISRPRGFAAGFTYWWENQTAHERAADVRRAVAAWLDDSSSSRRGPTFLYVHLLDPHAPYLPLEPYLSRFEDAATGANASRAEVASVDAEIQLLVAESAATRVPRARRGHGDRGSRRGVHGARRNEPWANTQQRGHQRAADRRRGRAGRARGARERLARRHRADAP